MILFFGGDIRGGFLVLAPYYAYLAILGFGAAQGDIRFVGSTANGNHFDADIWVIYDGVKLNSVEKDKGEVVKSLENKINEYSYTYDEPGTYTAVFHGFNVSADVRYDYVVEIPVTITD